MAHSFPHLLAKHPIKIFFLRIFPENHQQNFLHYWLRILSRENIYEVILWNVAILMYSLITLLKHKPIFVYALVPYNLLWFFSAKQQNPICPVCFALTLLSTNYEHRDKIWHQENGGERIFMAFKKQWIWWWRLCVCTDYFVFSLYFIIIVIIVL